MIEQIATEDFEREVLGSDVPVLVDFSQLHCLPCKKIEPVLEEAIEAIGDSGRIVKVMFEDSPELIFHYDVMSFPTMILFDGGELKKRYIGPKPLEMIIALFD